VGARVGFVYKMDRDGYQQENRNRPLSAWTVPTTVTDNGPDGLANSGDERTVNAIGLPASVLALPIANYIFNVPGYEANYKSIEVGANKRFTKKWSMVSSIVITQTDEYGTSYFSTGSGNNNGSSGSLFAGLAGSTNFPITPNGKTDRSKFWTYNFKVHGTYAPGWGMRLTPVYRIQQGYPYGRVFTATVTGVSQNFMAEDLLAHRMQTVKQLDLRAEKKLSLTGRVKLNVIFDVFNVFNANPEINILAGTGRITILESGASIPTYGSVSTILPPRIARLSGRLEW
jgi:hypothetical protein